MNDLHSILLKHGVKEWAIVNDPNATSFDRFKKWVEHGKHGPLNYLSDERGELRESISKYYPEFKSALVMLFDYSSTAHRAKAFYKSKESNGLKIANYVMAFEGKDYHFYLREKLDAIFEDLKKELPHLSAKLSLDTQPILERDLALRAGLGWFGKNSMLINKGIGSYFIISSLLLSEDLTDFNRTPLSIETDHCGQCTRCADACPTDAIDLKSRTIVAQKCISTFTIEMFKEAQAPEGMEKSNGEVFGCDICQDVCPWNKRVERQAGEVSEEELEKFKKNNSLVIESFLIKPILTIIEKLEGLSNRKYQKELFGTPLSRTGRKGMLKNLKFYLKKP